MKNKKLENVSLLVDLNTTDKISNQEAKDFLIKNKIGLEKKDIFGYITLEFNSQEHKEKIKKALLKINPQLLVPSSKAGG